MPMLAMCGHIEGMGNAARMGGLARAKSLTSRNRTQIARKAARKRWSASSPILSLSTIRRSVRTAFRGSGVSVFLFGSYARGEATARSDGDLMVIERDLPADWMSETSRLRRLVEIQKHLDLILVSEDEFQKWKSEYGTVQYEVAHQGIRLV